MPVFESSEALQAHRVVSQRVRDLQVVQDAAGRVEQLLTLGHYLVPGESDDHPYKSQCVCGNWFYIFANHLEDIRP